MRELADTAIAAVNSADEGNGADDQDEPFHLNGDQETPQNRAVRIHHRVDEENAENRSGGADGRDLRCTGDIVRDDDADARTHSTEEIELQKSLGPPGALDLRTEHPESQHVPDNVTETAVQEQVGDKLKDGEVLDDGNRHQS